MAKADWPDWELFVDGGVTCEYCGFDGTLSPLAAHQMLIDHVRPRDKAGPKADSPDNKVVACCACNFLKRSWDGRYDPGKFAGMSKADIIASAKKQIQAYYARWGSDYEAMIQEAKAKRRK
jgi:hypothetical protein